MPYDFSGPSTYELVPDGWYEAVIDKAEIKKSAKSGKNYVSVTFKIRDNVEQNCRGRLIFEVIAADQNNPAAFDKIKLGNIVNTQKGTPNEKLQFQTNDEIVQWLNGLLLRINVTHEEGQGEYGPKNRIAARGYEKSQALPTVFGASQPAAAPAVNVMDDDLPF